MTSKFFTGGDLFKAKTLLEGEINDISRRNLVIVSSLSGALSIIYFFMLVFLASKSENLSEDFWKMFKA